MKAVRYYILYKHSPYHKSVWLQSELSKEEIQNLKGQFGDDLILVETVEPVSHFTNRQIQFQAGTENGR